jgi:branched-chain amino acid transport system ATP-binding protein
MLTVENLSVNYGAFRALQDVSLTIPAGKVVSIVGVNGAGKTTLINTISGLLKPMTGVLRFEGNDITPLSGHKIADLGIVQVPEGRKLFPDMTVYENLVLGGFLPRVRAQRQSTMQEIFTLFPVLQQRQTQLAKTLSGGEQQMLAIGRALMSKPKLIMFDEPSLGLAPLLVKAIFNVIQQLKAASLTILLVEQNVHQSLQIADYAYVLETGQVVLEGPGREVAENEHTKRAYLGI